MKTLWFVVAILAVGIFVLTKVGRNDAVVERSSPLNDGAQAPARAPILKPLLSKGQRTKEFANRAEQIRALASQIERAIASGDELDRIFDDVLRALVDLDPEAAAELLAKMQPAPWREQYLLRLAQWWTAKD